MDLWSDVSITSITILKEYLGAVAQGGVAQAAWVSSLQWLPYMEVTAYVYIRRLYRQGGSPQGSGEGQTNSPACSDAGEAPQMRWAIRSLMFIR